jgi:hypothetical protein
MGSGREFIAGSLVDVNRTAARDAGATDRARFAAHHLCTGNRHLCAGVLFDLPDSQWRAVVVLSPFVRRRRTENAPVRVAGAACLWRLWYAGVALACDIPGKPLSDKLLSRDSFFVLGIIALLVIATVVGLGTSMPLISAIPGVGHQLQSIFAGSFKIDDGTAFDSNAQPFADGRFGLVGDFYSTTVPPLGLILVILLIIGPLLGWRDTNKRSLLRALRFPALGAVVVACVGVVLGARDPLPLAYVTLCAFAFGTNVLMIVRTLRSGWLRIGGLPGARRFDGVAGRGHRFDNLRNRRGALAGAGRRKRQRLRVYGDVQWLAADPGGTRDSRSDRNPRQ